MKAKLIGLILALLYPSCGIAQDGLPPNTIDCKQFVKNGNEWNEKGTAVFDLGNSKSISLSKTGITPDLFSFGGYDLYDVLEKKCGGPN